MGTWSMRSKRWLVVMTLAALLGGGMVAAGRTEPLAPRPAGGAVPAQGTPLSDEDEAWVLETSQQICDRDAECVDEADLPDIRRGLRDCLPTAMGLGRSQDEARAACAGWAAETWDSVTRVVNALVEAESQRLLLLGLGNLAELLRASSAMRDCLVNKLLENPNAGQGVVRGPCADAYAEAAAAWVEGETRAFVDSLTPLLDQGLNAGDLFSAEGQFRDCLVGQIDLSERQPTDPAEFCRALIRSSLGLLGAVRGAPTAVAVTCTPLTAASGESITCTGMVTGTFTGLQWSAPGGSPGAGTEQTFTTSYAVAGDKTIELTACNTVPPDNRLACTVGSAPVAVTAVAPAITALSCTPAQVAVGGVVSCTTAIAGADGATTRRWSAPGGDPADGRGASFSTAYAQAGARTITFRTCNGPDPIDGQGGDPRACAQEQRSITVTAAPTPTPTPTPMTVCTHFDVSGAWQTSQGNGYNPSFAFQQSGTRLDGTATLPGGEASRAGFTGNTGSISGTLVGNQLDVTVTWSGRNGPISGRYTATVAPTSTGQGRLNSGSAGGQSWTGSGPLRCAASR